MSNRGLYINEAGKDKSLSTALSTEISDRLSGDTSLSIALATKPMTLSGLTDVVLTLPTDKNILTYNATSSKWVNEESLDLTTTILDGQLLINSGNTISGTTNLFPSLSTAIATKTLAGLSGNTITNPLDYDILQYTGGTWINTPAIWIESNSAVTLLNDNFDLSLSSIDMTEDGGALTFIDMSVTTGVTEGTEESYSFNLDGSSVMRIYGQASGTTGVTNTGVVLDGDYYYAGDPITAGSWRWFVNTSGDLEFQKYTGGTWIYKTKFT